MSARVRARELLVHPASLASVAVLVANDHWLKLHHPGVVSGKLSDAAGLVFFPLLLLAVVEPLARLAGLRAPRSWTAVAGCALVTAVGFGLVKTLPTATDAYRHGLGLLQWPLHAAWSALQGAPVLPPTPVLAVTDPTDLLALPFLAVAVWIAHRRWRADRSGARARGSRGRA